VLGLSVKGDLKVLGLAATPGPMSFGPQINDRPKKLGSGFNPEPLDLGQDAGLKNLGSGHRTQVYSARRGCKTQRTWVCSPATPKPLALGAPF